MTPPSKLPCLAIGLCHHFSPRVNISGYQHLKEDTQKVLEQLGMAEGSPRYPAGTRG